MKKSKEIGFVNRFANFFGVLGYVFCLLEWLWVIVLYFSANQVMLGDFFPEPVYQISNTPVSEGISTNPFAMVMLGIVAIIMIAVTVYVMVKMPISMLKTSKKVVHKVANDATPILLKASRKKDTKKLRLKITSELIIVIKSAACLLPIIFLFAFQYVSDQQLDYLIVMIIGYGLVLLGVVSFWLQYLVAFLGKIRIQLLY